MAKLKVTIVGDINVGKTAFSKLFTEGEFQSRYEATVGVNVSTVLFHTNYGPITVELWDIPGQEKFIDETHFTGSNAFILMYDTSNKVSYKNTLSLIKKIELTPRNFPIVICGNKIDIYPRKVTTKAGNKLTTYTKGKSFYLDYSVKSRFNWLEPFNIIFREKLGGDIVISDIEN